jgi:hypothetical protein
MCEAAVKEYKDKIEGRFERHGLLAVYGGGISFSQFDIFRKILFFESREEARMRGPSESRKVPGKNFFQEHKQEIQQLVRVVANENGISEDPQLSSKEAFDSFSAKGKGNWKKVLDRIKVNRSTWSSNSRLDSPSEEEEEEGGGGRGGGGARPSDVEFMRAFISEGKWVWTSYARTSIWRNGSCLTMAAWRTLGMQFIEQIFLSTSLFISGQFMGTWKTKAQSSQLN